MQKNIKFSELSKEDRLILEKRLHEAFSRLIYISTLIAVSFGFGCLYGFGKGIEVTKALMQSF